MAPSQASYAPNLQKFLDSLKGQPLEGSIQRLISLLKRRQIKGSEPCAIATAHILLQVVARDKWQDVDQLLGRVQLVGKRLVVAQPRELVIGNIVRRVLGLIRDEAEEDRNEMSDSVSDVRGFEPPTPSGESNTSPIRSPASPVRQPSRPATLASLGSIAKSQAMFHLLSDPDATTSSLANGSNITSPGRGSGTSTPMGNTQSADVYALRSEVIDGIEEIMDEIKQVNEQVQTYSEISIHPGDYILVHQPGRTVQKFLTRAASRRKFTVFLAGGFSSATSTVDPYASFKKSLSAAGSTVVNVMNGGLMAYMGKVNKVILGARAISANGGVVTDAGAGVIARAAKELGRTVIVLGGVYKLSPEDQYDQETFIEWGDPSVFVNFADGDMVNGIDVKSAVTEFVPGELVDTYITNLGAHSKEHLSTIVADHYKEEDISFDLRKELQR